MLRFEGERNMRILVTGGAGFIGQRLVRQLAERGHDIIVVDNLSPQIHGEGVSFPPFPPSVKTIHGDIRDAALMAEVAALGLDQVFHLAAGTGVGQSMYQIEEYTDVNCRGTAVLLDALAGAAKKPTKIVLSSSRAVFGEGRAKCTKCKHEFNPGNRRPDRLAAGQWEHACPMCGSDAAPVPSEEGTRFNPTSIYGITKQVQEQLCELFGRAHGIPVVVLRYFNVYGPGQSPSNPYTGILSIFSRRMIAGEPIDIYEDGKEARDFVFIDDVVNANLLAGEKDSEGVFNICSGESVSVHEVAMRLARLANHDVERIQVSGKYRIGDIRHGIGTWAHAADSLGYSPKVDLTEGLSRLLSWMRSQDLANIPSGIDSVAEKELRERGLLGNGAQAGGARA
jgi:dTDP-L-rhamnose 4-epimerase